MYSFQKFATLNGGEGGRGRFELFKPKVMKCPKHFVQDQSWTKRLGTDHLFRPVGGKGGINCF